MVVSWRLVKIDEILVTLGRCSSPIRIAGFTIEENPCGRLTLGKWPSIRVPGRILRMSRESWRLAWFAPPDAAVSRCEFYAGRPL
jgi:hypothetical protein